MGLGWGRGLQERFAPGPASSRLEVLPHPRGKPSDRLQSRLKWGWQYPLPLPSCGVAFSTMGPQAVLPTVNLGHSPVFSCSPNSALSGMIPSPHACPRPLKGGCPRQGSLPAHPGPEPPPAQLLLPVGADCRPQGLTGPQGLRRWLSRHGGSWTVGREREEGGGPGLEGTGGTGLALRGGDWQRL